MTFDSPLLLPLLLQMLRLHLLDLPQLEPLPQLQPLRYMHLYGGLT